MKRFNFFFTSILLGTITSGCISQNPAPVEYSSSSSAVNTVPNYYGIPQGTKTQEEKITTQDLIVNEPVDKNYKKRDSDVVSYEEKIKNLDNEAQIKNNNKTISDDEIEKELSEIKKENKKVIDKVAPNNLKKTEEKNIKKEEIISELAVDVDEGTLDSQELDSKNKSSKEDNSSSLGEGGSTFAKPVNGKVVNKHEDVVSGKKIKGIYVSSNDGVVKSSSSGEVLFSGYDNDFGNLIIVKSNVGNDEIMVAYANLSSLNVKKGDIVKRDGLIGNVEIGKKVHIAFRKNKKVVDPLEYLKY